MHTNRRTLAMLAALGGALPLGLVLCLAVLAAALGVSVTGPPGSDDGSEVCLGKLAPGTTVDGQTLDAEQITNAGLIVAAGQHLNVPEPGETIALATAMQESGLHNLNYGDRDSLGLFQQRPSQGWGTPAQIMDPTYSYSATAFYRALAGVNGWAAMPTADAAQAVQHSGIPQAYAQWAQLAHDLATTLDGTCTKTGSGPDPSGSTRRLPDPTWHPGHHHRCHQLRPQPTRQALPIRRHRTRHLGLLRPDPGRLRHYRHPPPSHHLRPSQRRNPRPYQ